MPYTQEQLSKMSDYEVNCAVAARFLPCEYYLDEKTNEINLANFIGDTDELRGYAIFNPCNNPNDYMAIAIEHEIEIRFSVLQVRCLFDCFYGVPSKRRTRWLEKQQTGRAVCEAYLMKGEE